MTNAKINDLKKIGVKMWRGTYQVLLANPMSAVAFTHEERKSLKRRGIEPLDFETAKAYAQLHYYMRIVI